MQIQNMPGKMKTKNTVQKLFKLLTAFKTHLTIFIIVNSVLWLIWMLRGTTDFNSMLLYITITWSAILTVHYAIAYEIFQTSKKDKNE
jgi:hypothetical protein